MQGHENMNMFRKEVAKVVGEPAKVLDPSHVDLPSDRNSPVFRQSFCPQNGMNVSTDNKSSARIKIFQRSATRNLRRFLNLQEVIDVAQSFTSHPVEVITANESSTLADQIRIFDAFDILITSHGSHLTNGLFITAPHNKAIIEVVASKFDAVFFSNYNYAIGLANYIFSTGHTTPGNSTQSGGACPFPVADSFVEKNCSFDRHIYPNTMAQTWVYCADR